MKKFLAAAISTALVLGSTTAPAVLAESPDNVTLASESSRTVAFYGAEGGGMWTKGARQALENGESIEVYHVTNLKNSGEGSFRDAVSKGNRIVVFDVSGYIDLDSNVTIGHDNITILGQTAPGDGVCFRSNNIKVGANNVILRYLRFRVGAHDAAGNDTRAQDGLEVTDNCRNVIIDHCSVSWGTDENLTAYAVKDVTIQNSIIAEALNQSVHDKGEHSYGGIWGGVNLSVHHNLITTHKSRNPKVGTSETTAMTAGYTDADTLVDMKNNVFYNWGDKAGYGTENGAKTYIQNNVYRPGPATPAGKRARIFELSVGQKYQTNMLGSVYAVGNKIDVDSNDSDYADALKVNENNWQDDLHIGVYVDKNFYSNTDKTNIKIETPNEQYQTYERDYPIVLDNTDDVYEKVLTNAGATLPKRDAVDERIIDNVRNRTAPKGSKGSVGLVDDPTDCIPEGALGYDGRGYPALAEETRATDFDTDKDGIPDAWEDSHGLNKNNPLDSTKLGPEGYTWLEIYVENEITKSNQAEGLDIILSADAEAELGADTTLSATGLGANVTEVEFYCDGNLIGKAEKSGDSATLTTKGIKAGTRYITAIAKDNSGNSNVSNAVLVNCYNKSESAAVENWTGKNASLVDENYILGTDSVLSQTVSGDFDFVAELEELGICKANSELKLSVGDNSISYGYDNYELKIKSNSTDIAGIDYSIYKLFKISRVGNELKMYLGKNLAEWTEVGTAQLTNASAELTAEVSGGVGILNILKVITADMKTSPKVSVTNIEENQRLGFSEDIEVKVTPDLKAGVSEVYIYLDDTVIASYKADEAITSETTLTVPVSFDTVVKGTLKAVCIDVNLGTSTDTKNIVISQDITPWNLIDIGKGANEEKSYVFATDDYTYKLSSSAGLIGGKSDKFGYMYQSFTGDSRIYYRSRMQSSNQFGIVIKPDLDADGITYYFGGNIQEDGKPKYQLMARTSKGAEMTVVKDVTDDVGSSANLYFIVEKVGDKINIYQTENGSTVYTTKTLVASVDAVGLGDTYYMGYGVAYKNGYETSADAGWIGIEKISSDGASYVWDFDNGLDWVWQMQEKNVLRHKYTSEIASGNTTGKMLLAPDENYTGNRYVFHEYIMEDKYLPKLNADVLLTGDKPALNVYFQTGSLDEAYKITFKDNGKIYVNYNETAETGTEIGAWEAGNWYNVEAETILDETTNFEVGCNISVKDKNGNVVGSLNNAPLSGSGAFRTQINTEKKTNVVTKAVYFEPIAAAKGSYYIDNVMVTAVKGRYEVSKTEKFLNFENEEIGTLAAKTFDNGFEIKSGLTVSGKSKTIVDEGFSKRVQMDPGTSASKAIIIPTGIEGSGSCDIQVYAEQGGSSGERYLVLSDGTKEITRMLIGATNRFDYTYTGSADKLIAYSTSKIYVYGVKAINTTITENTSITAITGYDSSTGKISVNIGDIDASHITAVVASYDEKGKLLDVKNSGSIEVSPNTKVTIPTEVMSEIGTSYRVFLFDSMTNVSPICESFTVTP